MTSPNPIRVTAPALAALLLALVAPPPSKRIAERDEQRLDPF